MHPPVNKLKGKPPCSSPTKSSHPCQSPGRGIKSIPTVIWTVGRLADQPKPWRRLVEGRGLEPLTPTLRTLCSPNWASPPQFGIRIVFGNRRESLYQKVHTPAIMVLCRNTWIKSETRISKYETMENDRMTDKKTAWISQYGLFGAILQQLA